jgi:hypothetical protein
MFIQSIPVIQQQPQQGYSSDSASGSGSWHGTPSGSIREGAGGSGGNVSHQQAFPAHQRGPPTLSDLYSILTTMQATLTESKVIINLKL